MSATETQRRQAGRVVHRDGKGGRAFALRFHVDGERQYQTLGTEAEGWSEERAAEELENVLADVRRGIWVAPKKRRAQRAASEAAPESATYFGPFSESLLERRVGEVSENQVRYDRWGLSHLTPYFGGWLLSEIDAEAIDEFRRSKIAESERRARAIERRRPLRSGCGTPLPPLQPQTINKLIEILQWVLEVAREYGRLVCPENPAAGKRRRLKVPPKAPAHLDSVHQIEALLEAATILDRDVHNKITDRRAIVSTFIFAGPRAIELGHMLLADIDLANDRIFVGRSKTQAGLREVRVLAILRDDLAPHKAAARGGPEALAFPNTAGRRRDKDSFRSLLQPVFRLADKILTERGQRPLPKGISPHKLRHTFASVLIACGEDPASVMAQLGHTDPHFTMRIYTHMMRRDEAERSRLKALVRGERVIAVAPPEPAPLDGSIYEAALLAALGERGGAARRSEVVAEVGAALAELHCAADLERLPSGRDLRWVQRLAKARERLIADGLMAPSSARGRWELTAAGRERSEAGPEATAPRLAREAVAA